MPADMKSSRLGLTRRHALQLGIAAGLMPSAAFAQKYPSGPITMIIPVPAGGVLDVLARGASDVFRQNLGQPFVVENVAGATGMLGAARVARAKPDGSTVLLSINAPFVTNMFLFKTMPVNTDKELTPVVITTQSVLALVAHKSLPVNSLQEYIAYAKSHPGEITYASAGIGSPHHICGEYLSTKADIKLTHIPYKSSTDATTDVIAGHVKSGIVALGGIIEQVKAGTVKALAITDDKRSSTAPEIPTIGEVVPGYVHAPAAWTGMFVPTGTPKDVIATLNKEMNVALKSPDLVKKLQDVFLTPVGGTPEEVTERITNERDVTKSLVDRLGIVPQ